MTTGTKRSQAPTNLDLQVSERIKSLRLQRGLRQGDVAELMGIVHQQYHKYEAGYNRVSAGMMIKLAEILDCHVEDLIPPDLRGSVQIDAATRIDVLKQELVALIMNSGSEQKLAAIRTLLLSEAAPPM